MTLLLYEPTYKLNIETIQPRPGGFPLGDQGNVEAGPETWDMARSQYNLNRIEDFSNEPGWLHFRGNSTVSHRPGNHVGNFVVDLH